MFDPGREVTLVIDNVHSGRAWLSDGVITFRPSGVGRPETARYALVDGKRVSITSPAADKHARGAFQTRVAL